ncbi:MAG: hypothetical protein SWZ49_25560 [Cyanobacteriota bacterium]|nr:hypothetical protein [Cyanobacteriota bacterium]
MVIVSSVTFNSDAITEGGSSTIAMRIAGILAVLLFYWLDWYLPG